MSGCNHGGHRCESDDGPFTGLGNLVYKMDEPPFTATCLQLFVRIWSDAEKGEDVTSAIVDHIATVYQENSPRASTS